ncbi:2-isopropylmalate synthase/homocitrate synthase family protein [Desulfofundulus kuznetsovii DSM 6115]|uniref:Citramalate synthase n=1 Tax=Desulfofundulus kuznetsovii (strain DSM 6115 / VKM B-1805 / 17) TaxID=760568 RepID=A0AAU8PPW7_DESK7|nr:2-isopropylmalate synthase/homocitrate synthase family protein [Desulfofundulus kuznetsovii DSM 6115]
MAVVEIYDTTLRDGSQGEGVSFSAEDKVKIALKLDKMGFHYVEGGWPGSNPKDMAFFQRIKNHRLSHARIAAFGSTRKPGVPVQEDGNIQSILAAGVSVATIFGKSWDLHVTRALGTTLEENLAMIEESVGYLKSRGLTVIYDAEHFFDGFKANAQYALATLRAAVRGGADRLVLCDTNGGSLPEEIAAIVERVKEEIPVVLGIHCHNDGELAVANTLAAVRAGVTHVQGTINGYGERCGNANLCSVIPNLTLKYGHETIPRSSLAQLTDLSRYVSELANLHPNTHQPFVGASAFAHKGGVHVNAILKDPRTYEHIDPALVGNRRRVLVSELSGLSNLFYKLKELNFNLDASKEETRRFLEEIKELEHQGYMFEGAEGSFELLLRRAYDNYREPFKLESLRVIIELKENSPVYSEAIIKLTVGDQVVHTAAEGNGPVNALDNALRKALEVFYPDIRRMQLTDYKVRVLDEKDGTGAVVRVLIETGDGERSWGTVGVSTNIIEASWQALVDSIAYGLLKNNGR